MPTFPTLTYPPEASEHTEEVAVDPTIRGTTEGGYEITRARFTNVKSQWHRHYPIVTNADKNTLFTFERETVKVSCEIFDWYNHEDQQTYEVRFTEPIKYKRVEGPHNYWDIEFDVREA